MAKSDGRTKPKGPPAKLKVIPGPAPWVKTVLMPNWVQFPHVLNDITMNDTKFVEVLEKDNYAILCYVPPDRRFISRIGVLGYLQAVKKLPSGVISLRFELLYRIRIKKMRQVAIEESYKTFECEWEEVRNPEVTEDKWHEPKLAQSLVQLNIEFLKFCSEAVKKITDLWEANTVPEEIKERAISAIAKAKDISDRMPSIDRLTLAVMLDEIADAVLELYLISPGEKNPKVLGRFDEVLSAVVPEERIVRLLDAMRNIASPDKNVESLDAVERRSYVTNLMNTLLDDEAVENSPPNETEKPREEFLEIPEGLEPASIVKMREFLGSWIIGQPRPIKTISRMFNIAKAGLQVLDRPLLVEWWAGPSSVGKTDLAYALAEFLWQKEKEALSRSSEAPAPFSEEDIIRPPLIKVSCGMFAGENSHGISNLVGAPVGYYGSKGSRNEQPPILSPENFPENRITVLLFDEIEKAFIDSRDQGMGLMGILVEILDRGKFINSWGEEVDLRGTIVVFTSNIGSMKIIQSAKESAYGFKPDKSKKRRTSEAVEKLNEKIYAKTRGEYEKMFPPELRLRIHRFTVFRFLNDDNYREIIGKEIRRIDGDLQPLGIKIELHEQVMEWILGEIRAEEGVRKLRDFLQKEIVEQLARAHNMKMLEHGKTYEAQLRRQEADSENGDSDMRIVFKIK